MAQRLCKKEFFLVFFPTNSVLMHVRSAYLFFRISTIFYRLYIGTIDLFLSFRDAIVYATSTFTEGLPTVMNILSDGIFRQNIDDDLVR